MKYLVSFQVDANLLGPVIEILTDKRVTGIGVSALRDGTPERKVAPMSQPKAVQMIVKQYSTATFAMIMADREWTDRWGTATPTSGIRGAIEAGLIRVTKATAHKSRHREYEAI